jgi:vancomycin aglycone glucosyltransferase
MRVLLSAYGSRGDVEPMVALAVLLRPVRPSTAEQRTRRVADFVVAQHDTAVATAEGCDVLLATGMSLFVARSVAEMLLVDAELMT